MPVMWNQASRIAIVLAALAVVSAIGRPASAAAAAGAGADGGRAALAARCDELVRSAVRSSYGWGWTPEVSAAEESVAEAAEDEGPSSKQLGGRPAKGNPKPAAAPGPRRSVVIDGRATALIGLELFWAGELLGNAQYKQAALEAGRGLSAIQTRSGQVRARGTMGAFGGPQDPPADVPDRSATLAAMGLWLTMIDAAKPPSATSGATPQAPALTNDRAAGAPKVDDRLTRPAAVAAHWLVGQQTPAGAWPLGYPADAPPGKAARIVRLDTIDFRDAAIAILLAGEVLDNREARASFDRCVESLLSARISADDGPDRPLWTGVYDLQGQPDRRLPEFAKDVDLLACRNVMQVLLTAYLVTLNPKADEATRDAVKAIGALPQENAPAGRWHRFYDRRGHPTIPPRPTSGPAEGQARRRGMFARPDEAPEPTEDTVNLGPLLALAGRAAERGGPEVAKELAGQLPLNRRLAEVACGLSDDALASQTSAGKGAADARQGAAAQAPPGHALEQPGQAAELWRLLRQAEDASRAATPRFDRPPDR
jgi:hypothetical protein